jgi:uncharacterized protein YfaS (alpha-2-macroglobulin family)
MFRKNISSLLICFFVVFLAGCFKEDAQEAPPPAAARPAFPETLERRQAPVGEDREALARHYAKFALKVVDLSEIELDGAKTLALTFNMPLDSEQKFDEHIHLSDRKSGSPVDSTWELDDNLTTLYFRHVDPNRTLTLTVGSEIRALTGKTLGQPHTTSITTSVLNPMIGFASRGSLLPTRLADGLPVVTLNVSEVEVEFFRVHDDKLARFAERFGSYNQMNAGSNVQQFADLVYGGRFGLEARKNTRETVLLPIHDLKPLQQPGIYYAVMRTRGEYKYSLPATMYAVSNLGVSVHRYRNHLEVFVQALEGGEALADVELHVFDQASHSLASARTNAQGRARLPLHNESQLLVATQGASTTLLRLKSNALDLSEFDIAGAEFGSLQLFVFGPRDLYRPGETILLNALLRDADGQAVSAQPVQVEIFQPDGEKRSKFSWLPSEDGLYQYELKLSKNDPTGTWRVVFDWGDPAHKVSYDFKLEEFLPERMALELKGSDAPLLPTAQAEFHVNGRYLYGAPASGNRLIGRLFVRPLREAVPTLPDFQFGSILEEFDRPATDLPDLTLDDEGNATVVLDNEWSNINSPIQLVYQASLQESGGRPVTRRLRQAVWPAEQLPGVRQLFENHSIGNALAEFEIVMADAQGRKLEAKALEVQLIRERRHYYWGYYDGNWQGRYTEKTYPVMSDRIDVPADGTAKVAFPVEWGSYRLEVKDPRTNVVTSQRFYAGYSWQHGVSEDSRPDQIKLTLDKAAYSANDVATVMVTPPAAGSGYLMVESSEGPLWWQDIAVPAEGKSFEIPISSEWARHDLYVSAMIVRPGDRKTYSTPKRALGVLHLPLERQQRKLALTVSAPEKMRPNQKLTVRIKAESPNGALPAQTQVLVSAVDQGILNITDFHTPNPFDAFFTRKRYEVDRLDIYGQVIEAGQNRFARTLFGGDAELAAGGKRPDSTIMLLALQHEVVTLDERGEAEVDLDIPDFNGSVRVMAQVWNANQFGANEAVTVIAAPLVAELAAPRFLASGDETRLALDLTNLTEQSQTLEVRLASEEQLSIVPETGARRTPADAMGRARTRNLTLAAGERQTLLIPVRATGAYGAGKIKLAVSGLELPGEPTPAPLERSWQIGVRPPYPAETRYFRASLEPGKSWRLPKDVAGHFDPQGTEMVVGLSSRPPLDLATHIQQLIAYPYGCLEQTASGLYPSIYADPAALKTLGIKGEPEETRLARISVGITRLAGMQRDNGGFGLWNRNGEEEYWLTVYATDFLLRARERGFSVPERVLENALERLTQYLHSEHVISPGYSADSRHLRFATRAYAAYVLAREHKAALGALRAIFEQRKVAKTALPLFHLAIALKQMGDGERAEQIFQEAMDFKLDERSRNRPDDYVWYGDYSSTLRDEALIQAILEEYELAPEQRLQRLLQLSDRFAAQRWLSTQERNALFLVGRLLLLQPESDWRGHIAHGGQNLPLDNTKPQKLLGGEALRQPLEVRNDSEETLYLSVSISGYPLKPLPVAHNLSISREYLLLDGTPANLSKLRSGELILAHIVVESDEETPDALVVDLLPAGLELENQNLGDSAASLGHQNAKTREWQQAMENDSYRIGRQEFRDDRYVAAVNMSEGGLIHLLYLARAVTPGEYIVPPPTVHAMYRPEWQSIGAAARKLTISPR